LIIQAIDKGMDEKLSFVEGRGASLIFQWIYKVGVFSCDDYSDSFQIPFQCANIFNIYSEMMH
jgi:hypothetical protein